MTETNTAQSPFRIVYATDGSRDAAEALRLLQLLPLPVGTQIHIVTVIQEPMPTAGVGVDLAVPTWNYLIEVRQAQEEAAKEHLRSVSDQLQEMSQAAGSPLSVSTELQGGDPAREIIAAAEKQNADLVVVGSKGLTGLEGLLLGSVARNVARHCRRPVLVGRSPKFGLRHAVVATDGSEHALHAAEVAARLPFPEITEWTALNVYRPYNPFPGFFPTDRAEFTETVVATQVRQRESAETLARDTALPLRKAGRSVNTEVREGDPAREIIRFAEETHADLIVAGARGVSLIEGLILGSVADRLLTEAPCSVLLVH